MTKLLTIVLTLVGFGLATYPATVNAPPAQADPGNDSTHAITPRRTCKSVLT
jgi:hypothetical protein